MKRGFFTTIGALLVVGCTVGPDPERPPTVADESPGFVHASEAQKSESAPMGRWWEGFGDPITNALVEQAIETNLDLRLAGTRILEARALVGQAFGQMLPQVSLNAGAERRKNSFTLPGLGRVGPIATTYDVGFTASWQIDLFGKLRRQKEAADLQLLASEAERDALIHTLVAEVVRLRARIATLGRRLEIAQENVRSWERTYETVDRRYREGVATAVEMRLAKENLASTRASVPQVEFLLASAHHALDVILGRQPGTGATIEDTLTELPPLDPPPVGLPAALLDRRPDLRAAELRQAAATANIGVAVANLYPDLNLAMTGGYNADRVGDLFRPETKVYGFLADTAWRVFSGGALRSQVHAAEARAEGAAIQYAQLVLGALRDVEDALVRERTAREAHSQYVRRVTEASAAERLSRERYQRGVEFLIVVLETERRRRIAQTELILAQETVWDARINLHLALGGDWEVPGLEADEDRTANEAENALAKD